MGMDPNNVFDLLNPVLRQAIKRLGYEKPTRIQRKAIPILLRTKKHSIVIAPTGSGKTEAVLFPVISRILDSGVRGLQILYITPLRALNRDLRNRLEKLFQSLGFSLGVLHGDTPQSSRRRIAGSPPTMIITTPETLQYIIVNKDLRQHLASIGYVIVDEVHELMGSERGAELISALERLKRYSPRFMRIGLSGTIGNPGDAALFLAGSLSSVEIIIDSSSKPCEVSVISPLPGSVDPGGDGSDPFFASRISKIEEIVRNTSGTVIIFTNTRDQAERLGAELRRRGLAVGVHHGSLSRTTREEIERGLREGELKSVVATSSLELGIDVGSIDTIIQYMSPRQALKMVQRIGRSGHREDLVSKGYIIASENIYDLAESVVIARRTCSSNQHRGIERIKIRKNPLDVLAHQIAGLVLEYDEISIDEIIDTLSRAYCFRELEAQVVERVVEFLRDIGVISVAENQGRKILRKGRRTRRYYYSVTMIVDTKNYEVVDLMSNRIIGELDERFVAKEISPGVAIVLGGSIWRVLEIEGEKIYVEHVESIEGSIPKWIGQQIPVDRRIAREVCSLFKLIAMSGKNSSKVISTYPMDQGSFERLSSLINSHISRGYPLPGERLILIEGWREPGLSIAVIHTCLGSRGNETLGLYISSFTGPLISYRATPYALILASTRSLSLRDLERLLSSWESEDEVISRVINAARSSGAYKWYMVAAAKKMGLMDKDVSFDEAMKYVKYLEGTVVNEEAIGDMVHEELDIDSLLEMLRGIKRGDIRIVTLDLAEPTPLGEEIYRGVSGFERVRSQSIPTDLAAELVKRRLEEKEAQLVCIMCGYSENRRVKDLPESLSCPSCGSVFLGVNKYGYEGARDLVRRIAKDPRVLKDPRALSDDEKKVVDLLRRSADLVATYGKKAVLVMMGRGIGPETARDILSSSISDTDMYLKILEKEKTYISTKKYWD